MFISRMPLNVGRSQALRLLGSPYRVHAAVEHSFPPDSARRSADGRILWRVDASTKDKDVVWLQLVCFIRRIEGTLIISRMDKPVV